MRKLLLAALAAALCPPLAAQDLESAEIMVTGSRIEQDDYSDRMPSVGLRMNADFLVQQVAIRGDTRDPVEREREIRAMLARAVEMAARNGVELAFGDYILTRLTRENIDDLELANDYRPDSQRINFLVKAPLGERPVAQAQAAIDSFVDAVPEVGRAQMDTLGDPTLSVVGPDSHRGAIIAKVAEDARRTAATVGDGYAVELTGLNMPVQWARSGPGEVLLYIPYELVIVPRP